MWISSLFFFTWSYKLELHKFSLFWSSILLVHNAMKMFFFFLPIHRWYPGSNCGSHATFYFSTHFSSLRGPTNSSSTNFRCSEVLYCLYTMLWKCFFFHRSTDGTQGLIADRTLHFIFPKINTGLNRREFENKWRKPRRLEIKISIQDKHFALPFNTIRVFRIYP